MQLIQYIPIEKLTLHPNNPRLIKDEQFRLLCESIKNNKDFFETRPILCNKEMVIFAGNMRYRAAKENGMTEVPVAIMDIPEEKQREIMIRDNIQSGEWSESTLSSFFGEAELEGWGLDLSQFGVWGEKPEEKDDKIPDLPKETDIKIGDVFQLGKHRIMCGSSTDDEHIKKLMGETKARLVFTSPPYNMNAGMYKNNKDDMESQKYIDFNIDVIKKYKPHVSGFLFWNISYNKNTRSEFIEVMYRIIKETGYEFLELVVWNKKHAMPITSKEMFTRQYEDILAVGDPEAISEDLEIFTLSRNNKKAYFSRRGRKALTNYWEIGTNATQLDNHKACFPVALPVKAIAIMTKENDVILDPFLGSGSSLIGAQKTGRVCYGMELDPLYVAVCIQRWEEYTGEKANKL
jgi:DNA modification methylase